MRYVSIGSREEKYPLKEVLFRGLAPDGSLFMPEQVPVLPPRFINSFHTLELTDIAFQVLKPFVSADVTDQALKTMVDETFSFNIPLRELNNGMWVLELYHGPTRAFKDFGARFLSRLLGYFNTGSNQKLLVLTATSGDTGGAVANGFHDVKGIEVVILYPYKKVSPYQEHQMTSPGGNIHAFAVNGSFDDCQRLVKIAFNDASLRENLNITSANSINIGRLLPQMVYYFHAVACLRRGGNFDPPVISVPSGNFGNLTAAAMARSMGLPVKRFIAATNANDVVPRYLISGEYQPTETIQTIANAMDVGDPSNFSRLLHLHGNNLSSLKHSVSSCSIPDDDIKNTIVTAYKNDGYVMDPHTATAFSGLQKYLQDGETGIVVSTAHPYKFNEIMDSLLPGGLGKTGFTINHLPVDSKSTRVMNASYDEFKSKLDNLA